jgi:hypothetical protein
MRSGTGVGPGICRKCRPAVREEFFAMRFSLSPDGELVAVKDECDIQSSI